MSAPEGSVECVFVHDLDRVEIRYLPDYYAYGPSFRIPRPLSVNRSFGIQDCSRAMVTVDHYARRGKMFNGRPIFVAEGFDARMVGFDQAITTRQLLGTTEAGIFNALRNEAFSFATSTHPEAREIDRKTDVGPLAPDIQIRVYRVRIIVAVRDR